MLWPQGIQASEFAGRVDAVAAEVLAEEGVDGTFVLYDENAGHTYYSNEPRAQLPKPPASTFKILNSMVALEEAIVANETEVIPWDGKKRFYEAWNQDQTLATAFRRSAVWAYQWIAREVGLKKMQTHIDAVGYGNGELGEEVDLFWLEGPMLITPEQQVEFIRRIYKNDLPFSERTLEIVKHIMIRDQTDNYIFRGKTGWAIRRDPQVGWFVGYLETKDNTYAFALNVDIHEDGRGKPREQMTRDILDGLDLMLSPQEQ